MHPTRPSLGLPGVLFATLALVLIACAGATQQTQPSPQSSSHTSSETIDRPTSKPYTGDLAIFEDPKRDRNLQIGRVMDVLGLKEGSNVADIGAGSGWFTVRAARRVGSSGRVYAVEINRDYLKYISARAERENLSNVRTVLGKEDNPFLPQQSVDAVLILKTYHEIAQPVRLLKHLRQSMRSGARLGIIDRNGTGDDHGLDRDTVVSEARRAGFELVEAYDFVKPDGMDYFLVFQANG
jgi:SAM-dependent methyltransferase